MKLQDFKFPEKNNMMMRTDKTLLAEAKERGFYGGSTKYNDAFSTLFFNGGKVTFKKDLPEDFKNKAWAYCRAFMSSWEPSHEEKEAICALLMSELIEPEIETKAV